MKKLKISLVGQDSDTRVRLRVMPYAPLVLKEYLDSHLSLKDKVKTKALGFKWNALPQDMASRILADNSDVVGFSAYIWNYNNIFECARIIKDVKKDTIIIIGGPQVASIGSDVLTDNPYVDIVASPGPGEVILLDIIEAILCKKDFKTIDGICYYDAKRSIIKTSPKVRQLDYNNAPSPYAKSKDLFKEGEKYMAIIETSRGCFCDCGYCVWGLGKHKVEYFPLQRALRDIEIAYSNPKVEQVYFIDSNLLSDSERAEIIIKHILKQKRPIETDFEINPVYLKESTAKLIASLPRFRFTVGIQTVNPKALELIGKLRPSPEQFAKKLKEVKQWIPDVKYSVDMMLGLPGDDYDGFIKTIDFILSHEPFFIALNYPVYLLPGSRFFENKSCLGFGYDPKNPFSIIETETFPQKDIEKALRVGIWTQMLTFYYPVIAKFLYDLARTDDIYVERLLRWMDEVDEKINLFAGHDSLSIVATRSVPQWNKVKKSLLEKASTTKSANIIYQSVRDLEKEFSDSQLGENIRLGCDIFDYMDSSGLDSIGFSSFDELPDNVTNGYIADKVKSVFSRYRP